VGVAISIVVFAVGAILKFATNVQSTARNATWTTNFNIQTIGVILMVVGVVGFVVSCIFWASWGGFGGGRRRQTIVEEHPDSPLRQTIVEEHRESPPF
jgi:hypothetical protein